MHEERRSEGRGQRQGFAEDPLLHEQLHERLVELDSSWFYRVRGGQLVGPFANELTAAEAVTAYRAECIARISGNLLWRPWRKPLSTRGLQALRPTGT